MKTQTFKNRKIAVVGSVSLLMAALMAGEAQAGAMKADFNGDGYEDLVVGVPNEDISGKSDAGAVKIVYGRADGTWRPHSQTAYLHQTGGAGMNLVGVMKSNDLFGSSVAVGDFNDDGFDDLAVGSKNKTLGTTKKVGMVNIVYGSSSGLSQTNNHWLQLHLVGGGNFYRANSHFGIGLTVGDFNGDGVEDLASSYMNKATSQYLYGGGVVLYFGERGWSRSQRLFTKNTSYTATTEYYHNESSNQVWIQTGKR